MVNVSFSSRKIKYVLLTGFPQRLEFLEILENVNGHGKVMEHEKKVMEFCDQSRNIFNVAPDFTKLCFWLILRK